MIKVIQSLWRVFKFNFFRYLSLFSYTPLFKFLDIVVVLLITPEGMSARAAIDMSWELPDGPLLNIAPMQNHSIVIL